VRPSQPPRESIASESNLARVWQNLKPGDLVAGKYRVERLQSQGRLLCAVQVRHLVLDTQATLKYLTPEAAAFPETISSFLRGARLLSQLHTAHVVAVLDVGMLDIGTPYLVLEQPEGPDFAQVIRVRGALPVEEARLYVKQMCEGLAQAHALGLIHGGLRPSNIILTKRQDGRPIACVADFGNTDKFDFEELTRTDTGLLTPREVLEAVRYLSPDHARFPDNLDARCDIWSLGAIFFELLVGEPAFSAKTPAGLLASIVADELPPLRTLRPDAPEALEAVVRCCLAKQREARLPNGSQLLRALEASDDFAELNRPTRSSLDSIAPNAPVAPPDTELKKPSTMPGIGSGSVPPPAVPALRVPVISVPPISVPPISGKPAAISTRARPPESTRTRAPASPGAMTSLEQPAVGLFRDEPQLRDEPQRSERVTSAAAMAVAAGLLVGGLAFVGFKLRADTSARQAPAPPAAVAASTATVIAQPEATPTPEPAIEQPATVQTVPEATVAAAPVAVPPIAAPAKVLTKGATSSPRPTRRAVPSDESSGASDESITQKAESATATTKPAPESAALAKKATSATSNKGTSIPAGDDPFGSF
jgi:serine/threonine-protein kinase